MSSPVLWGPNNTANNLQNQELLANGQVLAFNGVKNYLTNPFAELGTTVGFSLGTVTLTSNLPTGTPTFGSGASGNLTLSATSTTPLSGVYSFSYASSAATTAGNFIASDAFTVDSTDLGKVLSIQFSYKPISNPSNGNWSGTTSNSFSIAIYDVTAGAANWIIPVGNQSMIQSGNTGVATASFQSSAVSGQQYRIIVYNANATAGAITLYFDQLFCGPTVLPNNSSGIVAMSVFSTATVSQNTTTMILPSVTIDTNGGYNTSTGVYTIPVSGYYNVEMTQFNSATANSYFALYKNGAYLTGINFSNSNVGGGSVIIQANAGDTITFGSNGNLNGTGSGVGTLQPRWSMFLISSQSGLGVNGIVASRAHVSSGSATSANNPVNFDVIDFDTTGSISTGATTWKYTAPVSGYYWVATNYYFGVGAVNGGVYKNGSLFAGIQNSDSDPGAGGTIIQLNAGDTVFMGPINATGTPSSLTGVSVAQGNYITINLLQGPSTQGTGLLPSINARYFASATTISGSLATINWTTKDYDTNAAMSSGTYTIPATGKYQVNSALLITGTIALNNNLILEIQKNGTVVSRFTEFFPATLTDGKAIISDIISCVAGDTIRIQASSSATTPSIVTSNFDNYFSIASVGY